MSIQFSWKTRHYACISHLQLTLLAIALVLSLMPTTAFAQQEAGMFESMLSAAKMWMADIINGVFGRNFAETIKNSALTFAGNLTATANVLGGALALVTLLWKVTLAMVSKTSVINATFEVLLFGIIAFALINNYALLVNQVWDIATAALSAVGADIGSAFSDFVTAFLTPVGNAFARWQAVTSGQGFWSSLFSKASLDWIGTVLMSIVIMLLIIFSIINIVGVFLMGPMFFGVGVIFGPLMIASIVSDFTRKWFDQWLNFMVGSAFLTAVAVAVLKLLTEVIGTTVKTIADGTSSTLGLMGVALLMASAAKLFGAVPAITDAIFPGRTGAGSAIPGGGGSSKVGGGVAGGATGAVTGAAAGAAVGAAVSGMTANVGSRASGGGIGGAVAAAKGTFAKAAAPLKEMGAEAARSGSANPVSTIANMGGTAIKSGATAAASGVKAAYDGGMSLAKSIGGEKPSADKPAEGGGVRGV
ncbi:type IV secretion system protein [Hydrogenophaga sp. NFH-34]|uniref:type IV secretion system protein n=1 Tax=Hydrogenophaga sp. NFH-34 TaxID=2744446 RepID=UPI001F204105|nr:type IV secretion system protein [Hydrogenophaga sp. NFH-34]